MDKVDIEMRSNIATLFRGQEIFITGGSGFMGKALVEKILRSCPGIAVIYLLLRTKKNKNPYERLNDLKECSIFDRLKTENPTILNKLVPVAGDVTEIGLGLSDASLKMLENVTMIFHVAASVRFDDPLKSAILMNTRGTREVMLFGEKLKRLIFCMHVSTTYCNPNQSVVEEKLYPSPLDWKSAIKVAENVDDTMLDILTNKYMKTHPNSYTFTKALAEQVAMDFKSRIPVVILRPSIVVSTIDEPVPGWLDNFNGPIGLLVACGIGIMRTIYSNPNCISDYTPCDIAVKGMLMVAWKHTLLRQKENLPSMITHAKPNQDIAVYNCCTQNLRQVTMKQMIDIGLDTATEAPFDKIVWAPGGSITNNRLINYVKVLLLHILPAIIIDFGLEWTGRKPFLVRLQRRIYTANMALEFFILHTWNFENEKFMNLNKEINSEDYLNFAFDSFKFRDVRMYFLACALGARKYLLKEKDEDLPKARRNYIFMQYLDKGVRLIFWILIFYFSFLYYGHYLPIVQTVCKQI